MTLPEKLNDAQRRRLYASCLYIDGLLCDMEQILDESATDSPFPRHVLDLAPAQMVQVKEHIHLIREQLLRTLDWQDMKPEEPQIPVSRAVLTNLSFIDIAVEELKPKYLRGSGMVPESALEGLNRVIRDLRSAVRGLGLSLHQEPDLNPNQEREA